MTIRYKLSPDVRYLLKEDNTKIILPQCFDIPILVDILEPQKMLELGNSVYVKVKLFFPNGDIIIGSVIGFGISLLNEDFLFDGRFNSTNV